VNKEETSFGTIKISNEVIGMIASLTAKEVPGVVSMGGGVIEGIAEAFGKKGDKGVKVELTEDTVIISLNIMVEYGITIAETALEVQRRVKDAVEKMTGLKVKEVNVSIQGVHLPEGKK
jgi:uncharacterized alkaline shock family protein YloU